MSDILSLPVWLDGS